MARPGGNPNLRNVRNEDTSRANTKRRALAHAYATSTGEKLADASSLQSGMTDTRRTQTGLGKHEPRCNSDWHWVGTRSRNHDISFRIKPQ